MITYFATVPNSSVQVVVNGQCKQYSFLGHILNVDEKETPELAEFLKAIADNGTSLIWTAERQNLVTPEEMEVTKEIRAKTAKAVAAVGGAV